MTRGLAERAAAKKQKGEQRALDATRQELSSRAKKTPRRGSQGS